MQNNNLNSTADDSFFCPDFAEEDDKDNNADKTRKENTLQLETNLTPEK